MSVRAPRVRPAMIQLTRLNNHPLMVNSDLIKFVEKAPDTVLTLVSGEKIVVLETSEEVLEKIVKFRRAIFSGAFLHSSEAAAGGTQDARPGAPIGTD
jgi:flagellar protein FlbD